MSNYSSLAIYAWLASQNYLLAWLASPQNYSVWEWEIFDLKSPVFWTIVWNRFLIGLVIALAGAFTRHPIFGFRLFPILRGAILGAIVSLASAFNALVTIRENACQVLWLTLAAGAVYGAIIDLVATKIGGEGKSLLG